MMRRPGEDTIKGMFEFYDQDSNQLISFTELRDVMKQLDVSLTDEQAKNMISEYDLDRDGSWNYKDFYNFYVKVLSDQKQVLTTEQEISSIFTLLDKDNNRKIDCHELKAFMDEIKTPMDMKEVETVVKQFDENGNGMLEFEEFSKFYLHTKGKKQGGSINE